MNNFLKTNQKVLFQFFTFSFIILVLCLGYLYLIGIPKTQAKNYYNRGINLEKSGDKEGARQQYLKALEYWEEDYIQQKLSELN